MMYLCSQIIKTKQDMEVISIERSTYEELLTSFNSFVSQMKAMAGRGTLQTTKENCKFSVI